MTETSVKRPAATRATWALLAFSMLFSGAAAVQLLWLLWRYVPLHAAVFVSLGIEPPSNTIWAIAASNWIIRFAPFVIIFGGPIALSTLIAIVLHGLYRNPVRLLQVLAALGLALGSAESVASALVVRAIDAAYEVPGAGEPFLERLRAFDEYRKKQEGANERRP